MTKTNKQTESIKNNPAHLYMTHRNVTLTTPIPVDRYKVKLPTMSAKHTSISHISSKAAPTPRKSGEHNNIYVHYGINVSKLSCHIGTSA